MTRGAGVNRMTFSGGLKWHKMRYRLKGSKRALAMKISERPMKTRFPNGDLEEPQPPKVPWRMRDSDPADDAPPEKKTGQSLLVAGKNMLEMNLPLWETEAQIKRGILDADLIHAETTLSA